MNKVDPLEVACALVTGARDGSGDLREMAGVLALLNLLGIVETFYGDAATRRAWDTESVLRPGASGREMTEVTSGEASGLQEVQGSVPPTTGGSDAGHASGAQKDTILTQTGKRRGPADLAGGIISALAAGAGGEKGLDPRLIGSLLGLLMKPSSPKSVPAGEEQRESESSGKEAPCAGPFMDPKLITVLLNFLAAMNKVGGEPVADGRRLSGAGASAGREGETGTHGQERDSASPGDAATRADHRDRESAVEISVDSNGTARFQKAEDRPGGTEPAAGRSSRSRFPGQSSMHRPGRGISRSSIITPRRPSYLDQKE